MMDVGTAQGASSAELVDRSVNGSQLGTGDRDVHNLEGRTTPTPESESAHYISRNSSFPSTAASSSSLPTASSGQPEHVPLYVPRAEVGLGPASGEDQLKSSLQAKDRIFLLVLAKEIEAFISKVVAGEEPNIIPSVPLATNSSSVIASMSASFAVASHISSTFQRMLVYKAAEWYGLKAVNTPEVSMLVGVLGTLDPRSASLRLSDLAPRADTPPQKFRIMQRAQPSSSTSSEANSGSRTGSVAPDDAVSEASSSRMRTLEEREAAYNKARERIYGSSDAAEDPHDAIGTVRASRPLHEEPEDFETAPRTVGIQNDQMFQPVYPSLYDTPPNPASGRSAPPYDQSGGYQHDPMRQGYGQMPMPPFMAEYNGQPGYPANLAPGTQAYGMPPYMSQGNPYPAQQNNGYPGPWAMQQQQQPQQPGYGRQMMPNQAIPQNWMQPQPNQPPMPNQPMPMIPQGMQYPGAYGYSPPQQVYPTLMQPTPMRPAVHPHSSASSSISSRSYQSYHDASRPHSRGSTTSNMSATSSVRFGAMYPANQGGGYRQKGIKGQGVNGMNGLTGLNAAPGENRRNTRPHSPSSTTTTSSRSSRQAGSISLVAPSQHPLPQRPDWAANNVPYQISAAGRQSSFSSTGSGGTPDFPPLARHAGTATYAEPMQVERAKTRPHNGGVWTAPPPISTHTTSPASPRSNMMKTPGPLVLSPRTPAGPILSSPSHDGAIAANVVSGSDELDFPRRGPSLGSSQTLFDPSAPSPTAAKPETAAAPIDEASMSPEDLIEAKLAAISIREGVTIGPPPSKQNGSAPSYAKIVKRD